MITKASELSRVQFLISFSCGGFLIRKQSGHELNVKVLNFPNRLTKTALNAA